MFVLRTVTGVARKGTGYAAAYPEHRRKSEILHSRIAISRAVNPNELWPLFINKYINILIGWIKRFVWNWIFVFNDVIVEGQGGSLARSENVDEIRQFFSRIIFKKKFILICFTFVPFYNMST